VGVLIDTSVLIDAERAGDPPSALVDVPAAISAITVAELLHGARRADTAARRARREAFADSVAAHLPVVAVDVEVARRYAALWAETAAAGATVGAHDLMIAATAQLLDWSVWTRNTADFGRIPGTRLTGEP
jgi:tRNA(fMet)-specific endonuclease VapC